MENMLYYNIINKKGENICYFITEHGSENIDIIYSDLGFIYENARIAYEMEKNYNDK